MGVYEIAHFLACNNSHLLTETEGNSMFCGPETVDVSGGERNVKNKANVSRPSRVHKIYRFPEVSVNKYFIIYQESDKRKKSELDTEVHEIFYQFSKKR